MKLYYFNSDGWSTGEYKNRNGNTPENVHIIPDNIPANFAFFDGSGVIAKTQIERNIYNLAQAELAKTARQAAKPDHLKLSENKFFELIDKINTAESLDIAYSDTVDVILTKASTAGLSMTRKAYYGMLLNSKLKEIEIYGGSWQGLPETKHILEG